MVHFNNASVGYKIRLELRNAILLLIAVVSFLSCAATQENQLIISEQGSFSDHRDPEIIKWMSSRKLDDVA
jgi:hypothetical protein